MTSPSGASGGEAVSTPFALVLSDRGTRRLYAVDETGAELGLHVGQSAADASALVPSLILADAAPGVDRAALDRLCDWAARFSPAVAPDPPDGLILDISGLAHLWGGETALATDLAERLAKQGIPVRIGVAATVGAAWALARFSAGPGRPARSSSTVEADLRPLPLAALRLSTRDTAQLRRLGVETAADLLSLPRGPLTRRFGPGLFWRLDQALGRAPEAVAFRRPRPMHIARRALVEPISAPEDLDRVTTDLCVDLCAHLEDRGLAARRFRLGLHGLDHQVRVREVNLSLPGRDPQGVCRLLAPKLETVDPGFGIEAATLEAIETSQARPLQIRWDGSTRPDSLAPLIDRLINRTGVLDVWRDGPYPSHLPERARHSTPPLAPAGSSDGCGWDPSRPRPVRLLSRPEPVEAVALAPDDPPQLFRWRGVLHRVHRAEGPERLAPEWWRLDEEEAKRVPARDYYRVEDESGCRFWLYRAGAHSSDGPARWWLHGLC